MGTPQLTVKKEKSYKFIFVFFATGIILDLATKIIDKIGTRIFSIIRKTPILVIVRKMLGRVP